MKTLTQAFVHAATLAWERMVGESATAGDVITGHGAERGYDVSAVIGLTGLGADHGPGALVLSFPAHVARRVVGRVLGADAPPELDADVADGVGEIANIIAGVAKPELEKLGIEGCHASLPAVVLGSQHRVFHRRDARCCTVRFRSGVGPFLLQLLSMRIRSSVAQPARGLDAGGLG